MVFSSVPVYMDHHHQHNWQQLQQQPNHDQEPGIGGGGGELPPPHPPAPGGEGSIRPGSMVDRARLAKLPLPEAGLNCPRCDSTNTKFCYFNNYSLSQPRHFCKTCRRYWTRGGALRSVPVGGGCRRNKRSSNKSKNKSQNKSQNSSSVGTASPSSCSTEMTAGLFPQMPLLGSAVHSLTNQFAGGSIGSNLGGFHQHIGTGPSAADMAFQMGCNYSGGNSSMNLSNGGASGEIGWRIPFLGGGFQAGLFPSYHNEGVLEADQMAPPPVKVESENRSTGLNLSRQLLGASENNNQFSWGGNAWTEFSGLNSTSSTSHFL